MSYKRTIAIVGVGPRGSYALENLLIELNKTNSLSKIHILLFEETGNFGNGQVYGLNQTKNNWMNLSERALTISNREILDNSYVQIPPFPSYHEWISNNKIDLSSKKADFYPPRAKVGEYLNERFKTLIKPLLNTQLATLIEEKVTDINVNDENSITIQTNSNKYEAVNELLLTIGHQPTKPDEQLLSWDEYAGKNNNVSLFKSPYPLSKLLKNKYISDNECIVGIRGFGLATIDIVREISSKKGGFIITDSETKACKYKTNGHKIIFVPFSLDGLPLIPKPLNASIDNRYKPSKKQLLKFEEVIGDPKNQQRATNYDFLINAFAPIAAQLYLDLDPKKFQEKYSVHELEIVVISWLKNNDYKHETIMPFSISTLQIMENSVQMAIGAETASLDYCIGQVWRHCQPSIYKKLSFNKCNDDVFAEIIKLDEESKRYSFGPPVESIQQLIALNKAGVLNLEMVSDPKIKLTNEGWKLSTNEKSIIARMMVNSILDSPKIKAVESPVIKNLLNNNQIQAVHDDFGISTNEDGYVISQNGNESSQFALLGRLAKGTIIGVDAILECFGTRAKHWAKAASKKHVDWINLNDN